MTRFSLLDLCPVIEGKDSRYALENALDLAQLAERLGYHRYWLAEHHNMPGIASAATSVVMAHVAGGTEHIRIGSGGIMLPNHAPLVIAEQFGTLEALFPGRIDLGIGRAPGTDQTTAYALRRNLQGDVNQFPRDVLELLGYFEPEVPGQKVRAVPGEGLQVPVWILGSSLFGAQLAASLGLPYAFASHFAPADMMEAIAVYRRSFKPSKYLDAPYLMLGFTAMAADTDAEARYMASSTQQSYVNLHSGRPGKMPPPKEGYVESLSAQEKAILNHMLAFAAIGSPATVRDKIHQFIERTQPDELIFTGNLYDHQARLHSFEIVADIMKAG